MYFLPVKLVLLVIVMLVLLGFGYTFKSLSKLKLLIPTLVKFTAKLVVSVQLFALVILAFTLPVPAFAQTTLMALVPCPL
jgi:hypothetical protein